jgi:hypothetical protein
MLAASDVDPFRGKVMPQHIPDRPFHSDMAVLADFGARCELVDKTELAAAARSLIGPTVDISFSRFVAWLRSEGYSFRGFDKGALQLDERCAYLRYDVHRQDLMAAYILADLHERLGIIGSFQITWKYWSGDEKFEPYHAKLLEFDRRFVEFGLHAAPVATWYLNAKLAGNLAAAKPAALADELAPWLCDLAAAYARDGENAPGLRELRQGADDTLSTIAASFAATFGELRSVSGHGNFLASVFVSVRERHPEVGVLQPYFYAGDYLYKWGVERFGFNHVASAPGPSMMWEGGTAEARRTKMRGRVAEGGGFVALLHPASWTWNRNATFFLSEAEAAAAAD